MLVYLLRIWSHLYSQAKFALSGVVATSIDYGFYLLLVNRLFNPAPANVISYSIAMGINFSLQKKYIFTLRGSVSKTFFMSIIVSIGGLLLSTVIVYELTQVSFYLERQYFTKFIATGIVFFYNFYLKRYIFETWV
jgi:putative flippase GtrA